MTTYNIEAIKGSTLLLNINLTDSNNSYINLQGYTARGFVKDKYSSSNILLDLNPSVHSSYVSGLILLSGHATGMAAMPIGTWVYDIELSGANNYVMKPLRGYFSVLPECTSP